MTDGVNGSFLRLAAAIYGAGVLLLIWLPSPALAGYEPPRAWGEGTAFIEAHGGSSCGPTIQNPGSPSEQFTVDCKIPPPFAYDGMSLDEARCFANGYSNANIPSKYDCNFDFNRPNHVPGTPGDHFTCLAYSEVSGGWRRPFSPGETPEFPTFNECEAEAKKHVLKEIEPPTEPHDDAPVAKPDGYWVKEHGSLNLRAPGVLCNDSDPNGLSMTAKVMHIDFAKADHPYSLSPNGALSFDAKATPGHKPNVGTITYVVENSAGLASKPAKIRIYIQPTRPSAEKLPGCSPDKDTDGSDHGRTKGCHHGINGTILVCQTRCFFGGTGLAGRSIGHDELNADQKSFKSLTTSYKYSLLLKGRYEEEEIIGEKAKRFTPLRWAIIGGSVATAASHPNRQLLGSRATLEIESSKTATSQSLSLSTGGPSYSISWQNDHRTALLKGTVTNRWKSKRVESFKFGGGNALTGVAGSRSGVKRISVRSGVLAGDGEGPFNAKPFSWHLKDLYTGNGDGYVLPSWDCSKTHWEN